MFDSRQLFRDRLSAHIKELSRYLKYIFNGHLAIAMFFLISALAVYYQQWLSNLSPDFPAIWVISVIFGIIVTYAPIRTLLLKPDLVFLIAQENNMKDYFSYALIYSYITQLYLVVLAAAVLGPLYFHAYPERSGKSYLAILMVLFIFKAWNLLANWWMNQVQVSSMKQIDYICRFILSTAVFYFLVKGEMIFTSIITVLYLVIFLYNFSLSRKVPLIAWEALVENDRQRMQLFYRIAHMFTDVPHLQNPVKKRRILSSLVSRWIPFKHESTYDYLFRITFIRSGDYLGMYVRLMIIGALLIFFVPALWLKVVFGVLFIYMSIFQMMTLYHHYRVNIWLDLYPVTQALRQKAIISWLVQLSVIQMLIYTLTFLIVAMWSGALLMLVLGSLFIFTFINIYVKKKLVD